MKGERYQGARQRRLPTFGGGQPMAEKVGEVKSYKVCKVLKGKERVKIVRLED